MDHFTADRVPLSVVLQENVSDNTDFYLGKVLNAGLLVCSGLMWY